VKSGSANSSPPESGAPYSSVTDEQKKELSDQVNALSEPLSQLTHTVLGVEEPAE
jgi:iron uptake system component EfeO